MITFELTLIIILIIETLLIFGFSTFYITGLLYFNWKSEKENKNQKEKNHEKI